MAKRTIGELATLVTARVEPFKRGMQQASRHTHKFKKDASGLTRFMNGDFAKSLAMGGAVGAGIAAASKLGDAFKASFDVAMMAADKTFAFVKDQLGEIDKVAKQAGAVGVNVEEFQRVANVLKKSGLDDANEVLVKFRDTLGDLAREQEAMKRGERAAKSQKMLDIEALGLNLDDLRNAPLDAALAQLAEGVKFAGDKDISILKDILGRQGGKGREFFAQGGDAVFEAFQKDRDLGFIGEDQVARVERFNDVLGDIGVKLENIGRQLVVDVADKLQPLADAFLAFLRQVESNDVTMAFKVFVHEIERLMDLMLKFAKFATNLNDTLGGTTITNAFSKNPVEAGFRQATKGLPFGSAMIPNLLANSKQGQEALNLLGEIAKNTGGGNNRGPAIVGGFR